MNWCLNVDFVIYIIYNIPILIRFRAAFLQD